MATKAGVGESKQHDSFSAPVEIKTLAEKIARWVGYKRRALNAYA